MADEVFRLSQVTTYIQQVLAINFESSFWVEAEIHQINENRGNYYLDLIEKDTNSEEVLASLGGRVWRSQATMIRRKLNGEIVDYLRPGMKVKVRGNVKLHPVYGMSFHIDDIDKDFTLGEMERKKLATIQRLTRDGIFEKNKALALPLVLQRIAVISSRTAAGYADFANQIANNQHNIPFGIDLYHARVQGQLAVDEMKEELELIHQRHDDYDAICILRGGGSKMDLSAFDDEGLNRLAASMPIPVITGIGHEIDTSILDLSAHTALKTPTALAAFLIDHNLHFLNNLYHQYQRGIKSAKQKIIVYRQQLQTLAMQAERRGLRTTEACKRDVQHTARKAEFIAQRQLATIKQELTIHKTKSETMDPNRVLSRGFALVSNDQGIVKSAKEIEPTEDLTLLFHDGKIKLNPNHEQ